MANWLNKILKLVEKTGDRIIVSDSEGENLFVVLPLEQYQKMIGQNNSDSVGGMELQNLTEDQLLHKINSEIAIWKESQISPKSASQEIFPDISENSPKVEVSAENKDGKFYFEPVDENK